MKAILPLPEGALCLDYFIGEAPLTGRGVGTAMIAALLDDSWSRYPDALCAIVAVAAGNRASWRALEKAGFRRVAEGDITPDNPIDPPLHYVYRADRP